MLRNDAHDLLRRAASVLASAQFGPLRRSTALEYRTVAARLVIERSAAGSGWAGPTAGIENGNSSSVRRAAWCRRCHVEVASALQDLRLRTGTVADAVERIALWVPEAERWPPLPRGDIALLHRGPSPRTRNAKSKRRHLHELPHAWLQQLWDAAADGQHRHLNILAVILATGCRPLEACWGVAVRRTDAGIEILIAGAKVSPGAGQAWRRLTVADDGNGPTGHLLQMADASVGNLVRLSAGCSPAAASMAVTALGQALGFPRRISAYDIRHQRCADVRATFVGNQALVAGWLGHAGTGTSRHYAVATTGGCRGARPVAVETSAPVAVRERRRPVAECAAPEVT
ncbi:hypothetical protein [Lichenicola sp.]|uniref:hypothetical protein n=1 Tax=Lichenicola sp. TaxID=2804529 RepID=UPI003B0039A6